MKKVTCEHWGQAKGEHGEAVVMFAMDDEDAAALDVYESQKVILEVKKWRDRKSNEANRYLWKLCELIAAHPEINKTKDEVYIEKLMDYGQWEMYQLPEAEIPKIAKFYKAYDIVDRFDSGLCAVRFYIGSSLYDSKQMSVLINGIVADAKELGISLWSRQEIDEMVRCWVAQE